MAFGATKYDSDSHYFPLTEKKIVTTKEVVTDVCYVDLDKDGEPVGIEVLGFPVSGWPSHCYCKECR